MALQTFDLVTEREYAITIGPEESPVRAAREPVSPPLAGTSDGRRRASMRDDRGG